MWWRGAVVGLMLAGTGCYLLLSQHNKKEKFYFHEENRVLTEEKTIFIKTTIRKESPSANHWDTNSSPESQTSVKTSSYYHDYDKHTLSSGSSYQKRTVSETNFSGTFADRSGTSADHSGTSADRSEDNGQSGDNRTHLLVFQLEDPPGLADYSRNRQRQLQKLAVLKSTEDYSSLFYNLEVETEIRNSLLGSPIDLLSDFRNPCWVSRLDQPIPYRNNTYFTQDLTGSKWTALIEHHRQKLQQGQHWRMRCLPSVFLCGIAKSGSTDLASSIFSHPDVVKGTKEFKYWNRWRLWKPALMTWESVVESKRPGFLEYVDMFDTAAEDITENVEHRIGGDFHHKVTMDATPHYLFDYDGWKMIPGNAGLDEPRIILAHTLRTILPQAKFVVILREPVDRLYSHFRMYTPEGDIASLFHNFTVDVLARWQQCIQNHTIRACAYNRTVNPYEFSHPGGFVLRASMYSVYLRDWLTVFPSDQFFVILGDDYYKNRTVVLEKLYRFLNIRPLSIADMAELEGKRVQNARDVYAPMKEQTRELLVEFFRPFNRDLAGLLADERFSWDKN